MVTALEMPRIKETAAEGTVIRWLKGQGDRVQKGESVVEVSVGEVECAVASPVEGRLGAIEVEQGRTVPVGTALAVIEAGRESTGRERAEREKAERRRIVREDRGPVPGTVRRAEETAMREERRRFPGGRSGPTFGATEKSLTEPPATRARSGREDHVPLNAQRKQRIEYLKRSMGETIPVTVIVEADLTEVELLAARVRAEFERREGFPLTCVPFVAKAAIEALAEFPVINSELRGDTLVVKHYVNLGVATAVPEGSIAPVIKNAGVLSLIGLARAISEVGWRAQRGAPPPEDTHEGSFTITNPGALGSVIHTPTINSPEVAVLSIEAVAGRAAVVDGAIAIRHMAYLPLSYDLRAVDGATATRFLTRLKEIIESRDFAPDLAEIGIKAA